MNNYKYKLRTGGVLASVVVGSNLAYLHSMNSQGCLKTKMSRVKEPAIQT